MLHSDPSATDFRDFADFISVFMHVLFVAGHTQRYLDGRWTGLLGRQGGFHPESYRQPRMTLGHLWKPRPQWQPCGRCLASVGRGPSAPACSSRASQAAPPAAWQKPQYRCASARVHVLLTVRVQVRRLSVYLHNIDSIDLTSNTYQ